ncbi:MAG: hypothetical protein AUI36_24835 [Cyanobacteria bacterium 13_1_40CM_2_61_4]|nr:MAG: hypothetical protein AUI36_24835 [Cyanobacteria bacterium 13_1_40CM_2_61_4]
MFLSGPVKEMALSARLTREKVRTTVRLPRPLYDEVRQFVERDLNSAETINDFFVAAILAYVKLLRRKRIDAAYACMSEDADYQKEAKLIAEEFSQSDWDALEIGEREP